MTPQALSQHIERLAVDAPITASYERAAVARGAWTRRSVWYDSQKEHWLGWLREYDGPGFYGRKTWEGRSAQYVYNHVMCPPMLLWLAEAAGVPRTKLLSAKRAANTAPAKQASQCAAIRRSIPWPEVEQALVRSAPLR